MSDADFRRGMEAAFKAGEGVCSNAKRLAEYMVQAFDDDCQKRGRQVTAEDLVKFIDTQQEILDALRTVITARIMAIKK